MKNKKFLVFGIFLSLIFVIFSGCTRQEGENGVYDKQVDEDDESSFSLNFIKKLEIADGYYPGIIFTNNRFYRFY